MTKLLVFLILMAGALVCCTGNQTQNPNGFPEAKVSQTHTAQGPPGSTPQSTPESSSGGVDEITESSDETALPQITKEIQTDEKSSEEESIQGKPGMEDGVTQVTKPATNGKEIGKDGSVERPDNTERDECERDCDDYCGGQLNGCQIDCMMEYNAKRNEAEDSLESCKDSCGGWTNLWGLLGEPYKCYNSCNEQFNSLVDGYEEQYTNCRNDCASQFGETCRKECYGNC